MKTTIHWHDRASFIGETDSGHALVMDGPPDMGGKNLGPRPMEMLLLGLGGCTAFDVVMILQRARQPVVDCIVEVEAERAEEVPRIFTRIHVHFRIYGDGLSDKQVKRAVEMSATKYCSASIMLGKSAEVTHDYEIIVGSAPKTPMNS